MKVKLTIAVLFLFGLLLINTGWAAVRLPLSFPFANPMERTQILADVIDEQDHEIRILKIQIESMQGEIDHLRFLIKDLETSIKKLKK